MSSTTTPSETTTTTRATAAADVVKPLPRFVEPMLARTGEAFDSDEYLFELKWDGTRAMAFVEGGAVRLVNRRRLDITHRFPDLAGLAKLPAGTLLDGEIVVLRAEDGKPDFSALQSRDHANAPQRIDWGAKLRPATFVAFDQLYRGGESIVDLPFHRRRTILSETLAGWRGPRVMLAQGVVGDGRAYFETVCREGLEGMIAKRLDSPYRPGDRSDAWIKVKRQQVVHCLVIGFVPDGAADFEALIIAAEENGVVRCVGKVGTGFDRRWRKRVNRYLWGHPVPEPVVSPGKYRRGGRWVAPGLYCAVRCMERTAGGQLRAPAVVEIYDR